ncbi:MAG: metal ABC transporter permease [Magnetococcales bacterium]|nr:metal ABC transporter permease [Magnetococcales bacterium]NGZ25722.1 metal ABC transporter permease [Magnetococcales bacterium]
MEALADLLYPFEEFGFMRRALVACIALSLSAPPLGLFLILRRMSLMGDAMSHAILPGAAVGFLLAGFSLPALSIGGLLAGVTIALLAGATTRFTPQQEDASMAVFYLISLACGVLLISLKGSNTDLTHLLFGSVLAVDNPTLVLVASIATLTMLTMAVILRPLVVECFDPEFLRSQGEKGMLPHLTFLVLVVLNLVGGFQALGTLMAVGLMILPAAAARFWSHHLGILLILACLDAMISSYLGLVASFYWGVPSGPSIILTSGCLYFFSLFFGKEGGLWHHFRKPRHLEG